MKISTEIGSVKNFCGEEKAVELCARAGFDAWDFSLFNMIDYDWGTGVMKDGNPRFAAGNYLAFARRLRQIGLDNGITCNQSHAPFPNLGLPEMKDYFKRSLECTAEAGGNICIIHPMNEESADKNAEIYNELLPIAKENGVMIAAENMWCWDDENDHASAAACSDPESFNAHLDAVNDPFFVACLDLGHAEMFGLGTSAAEMIRALGPRLKALHVHDNDLKYDSHWLPGYGKMDFDAVLRALKDVQYDGYLTLESDRHLERYNENNYVDGVMEMGRVARRLADKFESLR